MPGALTRSPIIDAAEALRAECPAGGVYAGGIASLREAGWPLPGIDVPALPRAGGVSRRGSPCGAGAGLAFVSAAELMLSASAIKAML